VDNHAKLSEADEQTNEVLASPFEISVGGRLGLAVRKQSYQVVVTWLPE